MKLHIHTIFTLIKLTTMDILSPFFRDTRTLIPNKMHIFLMLHIKLRDFFYSLPSVLYVSGAINLVQSIMHNVQKIQFSHKLYFERNFKFDDKIYLKFKCEQLTEAIQRQSIKLDTKILLLRDKCNVHGKLIKTFFCFSKVFSSHRLKKSYNQLLRFVCVK